MIKRYQFVFAFIFASFFVLAQSSLLVTNVTGGGSVITNSMVIYRTVGVGVMDQIDINIKMSSYVGMIIKSITFIKDLHS